MLGNDIVDLNLAKTQSNWRRKRYLDKIFTTEEQLIISYAENPDIMVWVLWSMKESAYKIDNCKTGIRNFAPQSLSCTIHDNHHGEVNINGNTYFTKSNLQTAFVHTIAASHYHELEKVEITIYEAPHHLFDYKSTKPACVSHHGKYLALIY